MTVVTVPMYVELSDAMDGCQAESSAALSRAEGLLF